MAIGWNWRAWATPIVALVGLILILWWWFERPQTDPLEGPRAATAGHFRPANILRIDIHTHITRDGRARASRILARYGVQTALNASGGEAYEPGVRPGAPLATRIIPYCHLDLGLFAAEPPEAFVRHMVADLEACKERGGVGMKISKFLGLGLEDGDGNLVAVDDGRLDAIFEAAGRLRLPVLLHSGDPVAFFEADDGDNERHAELAAHPDWSFHGLRPGRGGARWPTWEEVFRQYERRVARHPGTTFIGAHFGNAPEDPARVEAMLTALPNLVVETGARVPELGRQAPDRLRRIFIRFQDRILFGTDIGISQGGQVLGSSGAEPDREDRIAPFFAAHFLFFETARRGFAHPTPIQGDWTIDGISLPAPVLEKLYHRNAARVFGLSDAAASDPDR